MENLRSFLQGIRSLQSISQVSGVGGATASGKHAEGTHQLQQGQLATSQCQRKAIVLQSCQRFHP